MQEKNIASAKKIIDAIVEWKKLRNYNELSVVLDVQPNTISTWIARESINADKICRIYPDLNYKWVRTGEGPMFREPRLGITRREETRPAPKLGLPGYNNVEAEPNLTRSVPLISSVQAGAWTSIVDQFQPGDAEEWVPVSKSVGKNAFALRVSGTSMEPDYRPGDIIIVDPEAQAHSGSLVVARLNSDNEATFKRLVFDGARTYLEPLNTRYQPMEITGKDYTICGVVRQMLRDV